MAGIVSFARNHTVIVIVLTLGLLFLIYRKPKLFFALLLLGLFLVGVFYMITSMAGSASEQKKRLIHEQEKQSDKTKVTQEAALGTRQFLILLEKISMIIFYSERPAQNNMFSI